MSEKQHSKWKDYLLKSSLPLEMLVAEQLERLDFSVTGEYTYTRNNEHGITTDFSVDIHAITSMESLEQQWARLNLLVECKYNYPGIRWIFTPFPKEATILNIGYITCMEGLCTTRITETKPLYQLDHALPSCTRGVELHDNGVDPNMISRGLHQLQYALPNLVADEQRFQATIWGEEDLAIHFICPILVTTASLHVLKSGLDLKTFQTASVLADVAHEVDALIVHQEGSPNLRDYSLHIAEKLYQEQPEIKQRLEQLEQVLKARNEEPIFPLYWDFQSHFTRATQRILVVRFDALEKIVRTIQTSITQAGKSLQRFAFLHGDINTGTRYIMSFDETTST